jgi:hypothetical protein
MVLIVFCLYIYDVICEQMVIVPVHLAGLQRHPLNKVAVRRSCFVCSNVVFDCLMALNFLIHEVKSLCFVGVCGTYV